MAYTIEDWDPAKAERRHARFGNWGFQSFRKGERGARQAAALVSRGGR
jgi:hypothetical protein